MRAQVLRTLIDEELQMQEATEKKITVSAQDIKEAMERIARQNNTTLPKISETLDAAGVSISTLESQIRVELAWSKLVNQSLAPRVRVSDDDVATVLTQFEENADQTQYQVAEIFLPVEKPEDEDQARADAENLMLQVRATGNFAAVAKQFSKSASAATGGDIGWVTAEQLAPELAAALVTIRPSQMTVPVRTKSGFYILFLRDLKVPAGTQIQTTQSTLPAGQINITQVNVPLKAQTQEGAKAAMQLAQQLRGEVTSCKTARAELKGRAQINALGVMSLSMLQEELRNMLPKLENNSSTPVGLSQTGNATFFIVCDGGTARKIGTIVIPKKEEIEDRLYSQQLSVLARRYLRDLRRDAVVEMR